MEHAMAETRGRVQAGAADQVGGHLDEIEKKADIAKDKAESLLMSLTGENTARALQGSPDEQPAGFFPRTLRSLEQTQKALGETLDALQSIENTLRTKD